MFVRILASEARRNDIVIIPRKFASDRGVRRMCARIRRVSDSMSRGRFDISLANVDGILSVHSGFALMAQRRGFCRLPDPIEEVIHIESLTIGASGDMIGISAPRDSLDMALAQQGTDSEETESAMAGTAASENPVSEPPRQAQFG